MASNLIVHEIGGTRLDVDLSGVLDIKSLRHRLKTARGSPYNVVLTTDGGDVLRDEEMLADLPVDRRITAAFQEKIPWKEEQIELSFGISDFRHPDKGLSNVLAVMLGPNGDWG